LLVIPAGFATALGTFQPFQLDLYSNDDPDLPGPVAQTMENVLQRVNSAAVAARVSTSLFNRLVPMVAPTGQTGEAQNTLEQTLYANAQHRLDERPSTVHYVLTGEQEQTDSPVSQGFGQSVPGMGSMYVMFTVLGGMAVLLRERRQWTLQRLGVLPLSRAQILGGKIGVYFTLGMFQFLVVFAVGLLVDLDFGRNLPALLAVMIAFALCVTALTFALATRVTSEGQADGLRNLLGLTLAPLGGAWWPLEIVPGFMQTLGHLSPVAWAMDGFHKLIFNQGNFGDVLLEIGVLLGAAAIFLVMGSRSFRIS
jgi:ABC-2 type transport system permease protein